MTSAINCLAEKKLIGSAASPSRRGYDPTRLESFGPPPSRRQLLCVVASCGVQSRAGFGSLASLRH